MIQPTADQWISTKHLKLVVATRQLEEVLLSIEARQSEKANASIIWGLGGERRGFSDSDRVAVANAVMKRLKTLIASITKNTGANALLNMKLDGSLPVAIPEAEVATEEAGTDSDSDEEITIHQPEAAFPSPSDTMPRSYNK